MQALPIFTVDAFASRPFSGNPAAVCLLEKPLENSVRQKIAAEMNLSETAFIERVRDDDSFAASAVFKLRWFTPTDEVPLCGHATLASASVLFNVIENKNPSVQFDTLSGPLICRREGERIILDFPTYDINVLNKTEWPELIREVVGTLPVKELVYAAAARKLMIVLDTSVSRGVVEQLQPNAEKLLQLHDGQKVRGIIVTVQAAEQDHPYDFFSRYFAPWVGIPEDPVTGEDCVISSIISKLVCRNKLFAVIF